jgi:arylesterase/paraoxonase
MQGTLYDPNPKGSLYIYDYVSRSGLRPIVLEGYSQPYDFHPLGINFYRENDGPTRLFVVNHQRNGSTIDIFDLSYADAKATLISSISDGDHNIFSPNAIAPISYTSFYVTNDHRFIPRLNKLLNPIETIGRFRWSWVTLVDFSLASPTFKTVAKNIAFANGIVLTPTGREVIVASTTGMSLLIFDRDAQTNTLTLNKSVPVPFFPDNVSFDDSLNVDDRTVFDENGRFLRGVFTAGHPSFVKLRGLSRMRLDSSPSWAVELKLESGDSLSPKNGYHLQNIFQCKYSLPTLGVD